MQIAQALRAEGLLLREIAERMDSNRTTVSDWLTDPDGSRLRARKDTYRGECEECGGPTDGSNGRGPGPKVCASCVKYWTPERIVASIRAWAEIHGEAPKVLDWEHVGADRAHPMFSTVARAFGGSFTAGVEAAGLDPHRRRDIHRFDGADFDAIAARIRDGESLDDIALEFGTYGNNLRSALRWRGLSLAAIRNGTAA